MRRYRSQKESTFKEKWIYAARSLTCLYIIIIMNTVRVYEEFQFNKKALLRIITLVQAVFQMNGLGDWEWDIFSSFFKNKKKK